MFENFRILGTEAGRKGCVWKKVVLGVIMIGAWVSAIGEESRNLGATCTGGKSVNRNWRRTFTIDGISECNIKEAHYGQNGAVYLSGIGASDSEYFLLRLEVETLTLTWILTHTRKWYTSLASDESYIFAAEHLVDHVILEINANTGVIDRKYNLYNGVRNTYYTGITSNKANPPVLYSISNAIPADSPHLWIKNAGSSSGSYATFTNLRDIGKIAHSSAENKLLIHHEISQNLYLSIMNVASGSFLINRYFLYDCPEAVCSNDFENSHLVMNPDNDRYGFVLLDYIVDGGNKRYFLFNKVDMQTPSTDPTVYASTGGDSAGVNSMRIKDNIVYLLFSKRFSTGETKNILSIYNETVGGDPFDQFHECLGDYVKKTCNSAYVTTSSFVNNGGNIDEMIIGSEMIFLGTYSSKCVMIISNLDVLDRSLDWENQALGISYVENPPDSALWQRTTGDNFFPFSSGSYTYGSSGAEPTLGGSITVYSGSEIYKNDYVQSTDSIYQNISKGQSGDLNIDTVCSVRQVYLLISSGEMDFTFSLTNQSSEEVNKILFVDFKSGFLIINSTDNSLLDRNFTANLRVESTSMRQPINIPIAIEETHILKHQLDTQEEVLLGAFGVSLIIGSFSLLSPNPSFNGLWMIINQQQLLILMMMIDTQIHSDVRFYITRTEFIIFSFKGISLKDLSDYVGISAELKKMERPQNLQGLIEIEYESLSAAQSNIEIGIFLIICVICQLFLIVIWLSCGCGCRCCRLAKRKMKEKRRVEKREENKNQENDKEAHEDEDEGCESSLNPCCICFCKCLCKSCGWCCRKSTLWSKMKEHLPFRFFFNLYVRVFLESLFIVSVTALNELLKNYDTSTPAYKTSCYISMALLFICVAFILFCLFYFIKHFNTDLEDEEVPKPLFDVLFDGVKSGINRIYHFLLIFRKFVFCVVVFIPGLKSGIIFGILFFLQFIYWIQCTGIRKFKSGWLTFGEIATEFILMIFLAIFFLWNTHSDWSEDNDVTMREVVIFLIMLNTVLIVFLQLCSLFCEMIKLCHRRTSLSVEPDEHQRAPRKSNVENIHNMTKDRLKSDQVLCLGTSLEKRKCRFVCRCKQ
ncbi:unnamed protein product [Moneuplotes crassus]|uniref:Uncharacterized protein n=1 Tax=Euplotes crassus TaxID=5936 RepID=A0AAD1U269_EUPCR|nr:unnamed protein product [Moneuplotes crassus]